VTDSSPTDLSPRPIRIVRALAPLYPGFSATRLKRAVLEGQVTVNGQKVDDPGAIVAPTDLVSWDANRRIVRKVDTSVTILHEDDDAVAVVKPAGLLTHPTEAKEKDTLLSRVSGWAASRTKGRAYISVVHRLDKETSGVLVFARSRDGLVQLQAQLRAHTMDRRYQAVVEGNMAGETGVFREDLVEDRGDRRRGVAKPGETGIRAITEWTVVERFGLATLVEARLKTGRTHQIRVHFANAGHPLVGDPVYRDSRLPPFPIPFARQALHAGHLGWQTVGGERVSVEAPPPADFQQLLTALRAFKGKRVVAAPPPRPAATPRPAARPAPREAPGEAPRGGPRLRPPAPRSGPRRPSAGAGRPDSRPAPPPPERNATPRGGRSSPPRALASAPKSEPAGPPKPGTLGSPGRPFRRPGSRPGFRRPTPRPKS
jgi:23S rRNA pseudouridine1911/1915/1917 synthase